MKKFVWGRTKVVSVHMPPTYIEGLEELVQQGKYESISEAVRTAVRRLLKRELIRDRLPKRMIA